MLLTSKNISIGPLEYYLCENSGDQLVAKFLTLTPCISLVGLGWPWVLFVQKRPTQSYNLHRQVLFGVICKVRGVSFSVVSDVPVSLGWLISFRASGCLRDLRLSFVLPNNADVSNSFSLPHEKFHLILRLVSRVVRFFLINWISLDRASFSYICFQLSRSQGIAEGVGQKQRFQSVSWWTARVSQQS